MLQTHTMIIWAKAKKEEFDVSANKAFAVLEALKEFGTELSPNYFQKNAFDGTYESLKELLRKGVNKEGKTAFPELGYTVSFLSTLTERETAGIKILVGNNNQRFSNNVIVNLPQTLPIYVNYAVLEKLVHVFKNCVEAFDPYWGCVVNNINNNRVGSLWNRENTTIADQGLPTTIHWLNFFGGDIIKRLGIAKLEQAPVRNVEKLKDGYFIRLKEYPINDEVGEDIDIQNRAKAYFWRVPEI